jgi:alcohol dehydrogenase class IV
MRPDPAHAPNTSGGPEPPGGGKLAAPGPPKGGTLTGHGPPEGGTLTGPARFEFATAGRIVFGAGVIRELGPIAREMGQRALVVTGRRPERAEPALALLAEQGIAATVFSVPGEPTTHQVMAAMAQAQRHQCDLVIAFGGGSAMDAAKAVAGMLTNSGHLLYYLDVVGQARPLSNPSAPVIAIPTTAGTGCEVTRNAVLVSPEHRFKVSLRSLHLLPRVALVDPALTVALPREVTASTGLDALTQLIEPFVSRRANPMTDSLCGEGIQRVARSLRRACESPTDLSARQDMSLASLFGGLALANAGLGAVHGFAAPIGGMFPAPHGAVCAALLPHVMAANLRALETRAPDSPVLTRYAQVARFLTGNPKASPEQGVRWIRDLCADLSIPPLHAYGLAATDVPLLVEKATQASSMKANPIALTPEELAETLTNAL